MATAGWERDQVRAVEEETVRPLLARANLLRMRGQWDEAVAVCTEALRKAPESATAHSLLGDIYEAQGKMDDALQWYGMAVDLDPSNPTDRAKLDRVVQMQRRALLQEEPATEPPSKETTGSRAAERTLQWFDRLFPPGKSETIARLILAMSGAIAALILFAAAFVFFAFRSNTLPAGPAAPEALPGPPLSIKPMVVQPPPRPPATDSAVPASGPRSQRPSAPRDAPATAAPAAPATSRGPSGLYSDTTLQGAIQSRLPAWIGLTSVQFDPRSLQVALDLTIPRIAETIPDTRERVVRAALTAARVAGAADGRIARITARVSLRGEPGPDGLPSAPTLVFVGDAAARDLHNLNPDTAAPLSPVFSAPWWSPALASPQTPAS